MGFATFANALAATGLRTPQQAEKAQAVIIRREAHEAFLAREERRKAREARRREQRRKDAERHRAAVERRVAADRKAFAAMEEQAFSREDVVKVRGVWTWRKGRWAGRPVSEAVLRRNGLR